MTHGGADIAYGGDGNDIFNFGSKFGASDEVNGDGGNNTLNLNGNYSGGVTLNATTLANVQTIHVAKATPAPPATEKVKPPPRRSVCAPGASFRAHY